MQAPTPTEPQLTLTTSSKTLQQSPIFKETPREAEVVKSLYIILLIAITVIVFLMLILSKHRVK